MIEVTCLQAVPRPTGKKKNYAISQENMRLVCVPLR